MSQNSVRDSEKTAAAHHCVLLWTRALSFQLFCRNARQCPVFPTEVAVLLNCEKHGWHRFEPNVGYAPKMGQVFFSFPSSSSISVPTEKVKNLPTQYSSSILKQEERLVLAALLDSPQTADHFLLQFLSVERRRHTSLQQCPGRRPHLRCSRGEGRLCFLSLRQLLL